MPTEYTSGITFNTGTVITETKLEQVVANTAAVVRAGGATGLTPTTSAADITSTASEYSMRTATAAGNTTGWQIPAGLIGTDRLITLKAAGDWLYNSSQTMQIKVLLRDGVGGNTTLWDDTAAATGGTSATRGPWIMEVNLAALASASSQVMWGYLMLTKGGTVTSGIGENYALDTGTAFNNGVVFADDSASAVDMSSAKYLDVTLTWGSSTASLSWRTKYATLIVQ